MNKGIQVSYKGIPMYLTECKYFAFFELLKFDFQIQPHEMTWYLPDFLLLFGQEKHYVEVKGGASNDLELRQDCQKMFTNSNGFVGKKTMVGIRPNIFLGDPLPIPENWRDFWNEACGMADQCRQNKYKPAAPLNKVSEVGSSANLAEQPRIANQKPLCVAPHVFSPTRVAF